jgi:hypothetical protein
MTHKLLKFKLIYNSKNPTSEWKEINRCNSFKVYNTNNINLGVPTGKINNIIVIDLDVYKWPENNLFNKSFNLNELLNNTYSVKTPRGGYHLYYLYDEDIYQTQNELYNIDVRSDGGYIVNAGSKVDGKYYNIINDSEISEIPQKLKDFLLTYITPKKTIKKTNKKNNNNIITTTLKTLLSKEQLNNIVQKLDKKYWNGYINFLKFTSFCKSLDIKTIWDLENKKHNKYDYNNNIKIWNNCKTSDGIIINILKEYDEQLLNYHFYRPILTNEIKTNKTIDKNKLGYDYFGSKYNYIVKSDTGTGKTTSFKHYVKGKKFISIVSRISLADEQYNIFSEFGINCKNYKIQNEFNNNDNIIITIDSVLKLHKIDFSNYIIFLDEYNSLINYLITSTTLKNKRTTIYNMFIKILSKCKQFIGTDADISDNSLIFLDYINKKYKYVDNIYKHNNNVKAFEIFDISKFINELKTQNKYLVCCDSKKNAELLYKEINDKNIKLITSETDEYINFDKHDKIIYSPKIIYGIDSSMKRNVYCFYKEHTISPSAMVQQVARCRNIQNLKFLFIKKKLNYNDMTLEECKERIINEDKYGTIEFELNCTEEVNKQYIELLSRFEYDNICYDTNKYAHFIKLLKQRGFVIQTINKKTNKDTFNDLLKDMKKMKEEEFNINNKQVLKINEMLKLPESEIENYKKYFLDPELLKKHFNFCKFLKREQEDLEYELNEKSEFINKKVLSKNMKIIYMQKLLKELDTDLNNVLSVKKFNINTDKRKDLFNEYNIIFRNRSKRDFNNDIDIQYYIRKIIKDLFSSNVINTISIMKGKKYIINKDFINETNKLFNFRNINNNEYLF